MTLADNIVNSAALSEADKQRARAAQAERELRKMTGRPAAIMIAKIIEDEIGGEVCTPSWAQAAADRIVCALRYHEQTAPENKA